MTTMIHCRMKRKLSFAIAVLMCVAAIFISSPVKTYASYSAAYYSVNTCEYPDTVYTVGYSVNFAQQLLENFGYYYGGVDGDFGYNTQTAVYNYQYAHGLQMDGQVGFYTWGSLLTQGELSTWFSCRTIGRNYGLCLYEIKETANRCLFYKVDNASVYTTLYF